MNPTAGQSADMNTLARMIAAARMQKLQNKVGNSPVGQAAQGYMADFQPENPNQAFQVGQAAANSPTPAGIIPKLGRGMEGLMGLAAGIAKFNPRKDAMLAEDVNEVMPVISRYMTSKQNPNYFMNELPKDESLLRQVAGAYIDNNFAAKDPLDNVAQELLNRINVDRSMGNKSSTMLESFNEARDYVNNKPKKTQSKYFDISNTNVPWPRKK